MPQHSTAQRDGGRGCVGAPRCRGAAVRYVTNSSVMDKSDEKIERKQTSEKKVKVGHRLIIVTNVKNWLRKSL